MNNDEQYVPSESVVRNYYVDAASNLGGLRDAAFDRFLARVKRDAAREALDGLANEANHVDWEMDGPAFALRVRRFKNRNHPEESP